MGVINFAEQQRSVLIYDYLVYICGVDVSPYIEDLTIYYQDRSGYGSADIVLSNPFDQWVLTEDNLQGKFRLSSDRYTEKPKAQIYNAKKNLSKGLVIKNQSGATSVNSDFLKRYPFGPGSCVFSRFDTVKIFIKNPTDPTSMDRWIPAFTGTVENKPISTDYVMGKSLVSLHVYDIKATMQGMRVATNPVKNAMFQASGQQQVVFFNSDAAGFFKDMYPSAGQHGATFDNIFQGKKFTDMVSMVITGSTGWVDGNKPVPNGQGVGFFQPGVVTRYANPNNKEVTDSKKVSSLESWDNLCLFGLDASGKPRNNFLTFNECDSIGRQSFWQQPYSPMNGYMHFLIPAVGLKITDMIDQSVEGLNDITSSPDWTNRYELITRVCNQIDYEWSVTGSGDIVFEFPMYDFYPENFGSNSSLYTVQKHLTTDEVSDEGGELFSAIEVSSTSVMIGTRERDNLLNAVPPAVNAPNMRVVAMSNLLAAKYGARVAQQTLHGVSTVTALKKLAMIELFKRLADSNKLSIGFTPIRVFLRPNRPLKHAEKNRIGKITSVRLNFPSLREPTTSVALHCVRTSTLDKDGNLMYFHIAGGDGSPLSYNAYYEGGGGNGAPVGNPDSGITVIELNTKDQQQK